MDELSTTPDARTAHGRDLQAKLKPCQWAARVAKAREQARVVSAVRAGVASGKPMSKVLRDMSPKTPWPTFQYWNARVEEDCAMSWEDFLDRRVPPLPRKIPEKVRLFAVALRSVSADIDYSEARRHLIKQHGSDGDISDSSLLRIWQDAGLIGESVDEEEEVAELFHGGAGLAFVAAAAAETGTMRTLAAAVLREAREKASQQTLGTVRDETAGRDEKGRLTGRYNEIVRAGVKDGQPDCRWTPDYQKRQERNLAGLQVLEHSEQVVEDKLLAMAAAPFLTERRGFDGLDGPRGAWLGVLGGHPYKSPTLDKFLAQLGMLDVEDGLWTAHATSIARFVARWAASAGCPAWLSVVMYVDATQEPYWTRKYAKSGKISRTNDVGPCLTRIAVNAGPGQPMVVETFSGSTSLKKELPRVLERMDAVIGEGELGRLLVMDAEMATGALLTLLKEDPHRDFVTVLKGASVPKNFVATSRWKKYRTRDKIREGTVVLQGEGVPEGGLRLRVVEMRREGRRTQSTHFGTSCTPESMRTSEVADAYLSRWPNQEGVFRNTRNGLGQASTQGFSGELVAYVALDTKREKAERRLARTRAREQRAAAQVAAAQALAPTPADATSETKALAKLAKQEMDAASKAVRQAEATMEAIATTPRVIYERDTARENIVTAVRMHLFFLIEYVLREYFGNLSMELRTFIEHFVTMPVTVVTTDTTTTYQIEACPRHRDRTRYMRDACEEATRRKIVKAGRTLSFEVVEPVGAVRRKRVKAG